jgi:hypothetical protein
MPVDRDLMPTDAIRAVESLVEAFDGRSIRYALIGGLAYLLRGRPRFTRDIDFLIEVPQLALPGLLDDLIGRGFTLDPTAVIREYIHEHVTSFTFGTVRIDWLKPILPFYTRALADAKPLEWSKGHPVRVATAEGLVLTKVVAFRPQDLIDIESLLTANRDTIDINLIREQWFPFAAKEVERTTWLEAVIERRVVRRE